MPNENDFHTPEVFPESKNGVYSATQSTSSSPPRDEKGIRVPVKPGTQEIHIIYGGSAKQTLLSGCFGAFFKLAGYVVVFGVLLGGLAIMGGKSSSTIREEYVSGKKHAKQKVAILTVEGVIYDGEGSHFVKQLEKATEDDSVKAIVLRINSPGGTVSASDYYHHKILELKETRNIPIVVSMGNMAASGGYYIAVTGDEIFAEPSTLTGSIGVIMPNYNLSGLCEKIGVKSDAITSGPLKELGNLTREMKPEERAVLESIVLDMFERFKEIVCEGRKALRDDSDLLREVTTGRVFLAKDALEKHLIDEIGYLDEAVASAAKRAGLTEEEYETVRYEPPKSTLDLIFGASGVERAVAATLQNEASLAVEILNEAVTPRIYYMYPQALPLKK
ncbi:MAG: signal peptide peptidase SppA [Planctomycetaceae bacterium]|jgi:protease-4|nr:signal peptide peptidase SppA [Planctomycetaceae bacterium]